MDSPEANINGASNGGKKYRFDEFELDPPNRILLRNGETIPLPGKAFDVLVHLVENPGRLVSKDELAEIVWASSFVEEGNVARNVSKLRKALGDEGKAHRYIATVQGHGYRFIGEVRNGYHGNGVSPIAAGHSPVAVDDIRRRPIVLWILTVTVFVAGTVLALSQLALDFQSSGGSYSFENPRITKITQTGDVYAPRISPDGQYLAYISTANNSHSLTVRHNASGSVLTLVPEAAGIWALEIAPDNTSLYYIQKRSDSEKGNLYRIPLLGGIPFKVAEDASGGLTFSPDGTELAFVRKEPENNRCSIVVIDKDGMSERSLHSITYEDMYHALDWSPDGRTLAASIKIAEPNGQYSWHLSEIRVSDGSELRIGNGSEMLVTGLEWLPEKSGLIVNAIDRQTKQAQIYRVSYPDGLFRRITNDLDQYQGVSITADGRRLVTMQQEINRQIWSYTDGTASRLTAGGQLHIDSVDWIGDDSIAFSEDVNGTRNNYNIWRMRADGSEKQQLTFGGGYNVELSASSDKRYIAFVSRRSGRDQIWRIGVDGSQLTQLTNVAHNVTFPMFSADSKTVYFLAWVNAGLRLYQVPADGGEATLVSNNDIYHTWAPSPDGKQIAYLTFDQEAKRRRTVIASLGGAMTERLLDIVPETCLRWSADGRSLYFTSSEDGVRNVWRLRLDGGKPEPVTNFLDERVFRFAVSPRAGNLAVVRESIIYDGVLLTADGQ